MAGEHRGRLCLCANAAMRRRRIGTNFLKWKLPFRKQKNLPLAFFFKKIKFPWLQLIREGERGGCWPGARPYVRDPRLQTRGGKESLLLITTCKQVNFGRGTQPQHSELVREHGGHTTCSSNWADFFFLSKSILFVTHV
jgi:hypothetical protein